MTVQDLYKRVGEINTRLTDHLATCTERNRHMDELLTQLKKTSYTIRSVEASLSTLPEIEEKVKSLEQGTTKLEGGYVALSVVAVALLQVATLGVAVYAALTN